MSKHSLAVGKKKQDQKNLEKRNKIWGNEIQSLSLWDKESHKGFASVPRTLPQLSRIMDKFSGKGHPVSPTYLSLLCNVFSHSFIEIKDKKRLAFESGFSGQRALTTWHKRMKNLESMGFINCKPGMDEEFRYVLILDPFLAVKNLYKGMGEDQLYNGLVIRMSDVGTGDL